MRFLLTFVISLSLIGCSTLPNNANQDNAELALKLIHAKRYNLAKRALILAQAQDPNSNLVVVAKAYYNDAIGRPKQAKNLLKHLILQAPKQPNIISIYAELLCKYGQAQRGLKYFQQALKLDTNLQPGATYQDAALCALKLHGFNLAKNYFQQAVDNNPALAQSYYQLALITYREHRYKTAQDNIEIYYQHIAKPSRSKLRLGIEIAERLHDGDTAATLQLQLNSDL